MVFYTGDRFPAWRGDLFLGGLAGLQLQRVTFDNGAVVGRELLLGELGLRIRDVRQGPDGFLYVVVDADPDGAILRIEPADEAPGTTSFKEPCACHGTLL